MGLADHVQQRRLAVIHVSHDGDHGGPGQQIAGLVGPGLEQGLLLESRLFHLVAEFVGHQDGGFKVDGLVDGGHHAHAHQFADQLVGLEPHAFSQFAEQLFYR